MGQWLLLALGLCCTEVRALHGHVREIVEDSKSNKDDTVNIHSSEAHLLIIEIAVLELIKYLNQLEHKYRPSI